jgi:dUTP pyrophosphatase
MSDSIKFLKTRDVKSPSRAHPTDAGIDFYVPEITEEFVKILKDKNPTIADEDIKLGLIYIQPQHRALIPSGIHCQMSENDIALIAFNKSGIAANLGLVVGCAVVDSTYQGEIHISLINTSNKVVILTSGMKVFQFIEMPIYCSRIKVEENKTLKEFYEKETKRGKNGFGSSD